MSNFFASHDPDIASYCMDAEDEIKSGKNIDLVFWQLIYKISPRTEKFFWSNSIYSSIVEFGQEILNDLRKSDFTKRAFWDEIIKYHLPSEYMKIHGEDNHLISAVRVVEISNFDRGDDLRKYYVLAYLLVKKTELKIADKLFYTIEELSAYMNELAKLSIEDFEDFCYKMVMENNQLSPEFEAWLIALGKREEIEKWKQNLKISG